MFRVLFAVASIGLALSAQPVSAQSIPRPVQTLGMTAEEKADLTARIKAAQGNLRSGAPMYFQLLSGAAAANPMTTTSPRDAFLSASFDQPFRMERWPSDNPGWQPYLVTLTPNGVGDLLWDVYVVLGFNGQIERIEMFYRPPHPF